MNVVKDYNVTKFPQIVIEESVNHITGETFDPPKLNYYEGPSKVDDIMLFAEKFARPQRLTDYELNGKLILYSRII